jgi:hypothetical protein
MKWLCTICGQVADFGHNCVQGANGAVWECHKRDDCGVPNCFVCSGKLRERYLKGAEAL